MNRPAKQRLLLVGGGHAHLEVVRRLADRRDVAATLVNPGRHAAYSGMISGLIAGHYRFEEAHIDLGPLCARSGVELVSAKATRIDPVKREVACDDGVVRSFDVVSIDTGSTPSLADVPGAVEYAVPVKPVGQFLARWNQLLAAGGQSPIHIVVVGGGAGGVELVLAMQHCLATRSRTPDTRPAKLTLVSDSLLPGHAERARELVRGILRLRGIATVHERARRLTAGCVHTAQGKEIPADFVVFATRASAPGWIAESGLGTDSLGFIAVNPHLQSVSHATVFAAGDVATMVATPAPKSGVYAVRAGPVLYENLSASLAGRPLTAEFEPQRRALALIATGDRDAVASYGSAALAGRWLWRWKDRIDRRFVARYAGSGARSVGYFDHIRRS